MKTFTGPEPLTVPGWGILVPGQSYDNLPDTLQHPDLIDATQQDDKKKSDKKKSDSQDVK